MYKVLYSDIDRSVNFIHKFDGHLYESRYVKRRNDDFTCYLSSHSGCKYGCKFCHLTATKQTTFREATVEEIKIQAKRVVEHERSHHAVPTYESSQVNFSFMARGEALASSTVREQWNRLSLHLSSLVPEKMVTYNISTIMPRSVVGLSKSFDINHPQIYYSLYSIDEDFRMRWMPGAMGWRRALEELKKYQDYSQKIVKIHGALIKNGNDDLDMWHKICDEIQNIGLITTIQFVRYNPASQELSGVESDLLQTITSEINRRIPTRIIDRVGEDVHASCGMFVSE